MINSIFLSIDIIAVCFMGFVFELNFGRGNFVYVLHIGRKNISILNKSNCST